MFLRKARTGTRADTSSRRPIFYGWIVVAAAGLGLFFGGAPIVVYSFGVFLKPLRQEFHVGRGGISLAFTLHNSDGVLLLVEYCLGEEAKPSFADSVDVVMLVLTGGKERTEDEFRELLTSSGG